MILDVVYNHLGPDGNYLGQFSERLLHRPAQERVGRGDQLRRPAAPGRCASSSSPTPATGSTSSTSTACGSTRRRTSTTPRRDAHPRRRSRARVREAARGRATLIVAENEPQETRLRPPAERGGYGLDALWNDDFHHTRDGRADRPQRGLLHRLPRARRRSSSRPSSTGFLYQGQRYSLAEAAARHAGARPAAGARSSPSSRTTTRSPTPARGERPATARRAPGRYRAMTALLLLAPGHADALPGPGVRRLGAVPLLRRPQPRAGARSCARGGRSSWRSSPASPAPEMQAQLADPADPRDVRALQARLRRARAARRASTPCTATCCGCAARDPVFRRPAPARRRRRGARARGVRAALLRRRAATTGCCWSTSAATSPRARRPSRCSPRRRDALWHVCGRARTRATAAAARRRSRPRTAGASRARRPIVLDAAAGTRRVAMPTSGDRAEEPENEVRRDAIRRGDAVRPERAIASPATPARPGPLLDARVAGHQRPRRLRLGHRRRRADAPLPRPARSPRCPRRSAAR